MHLPNRAASSVLCIAAFAGYVPRRVDGDERNPEVP